MIAEVLINSNVKNLNKYFDYKVPVELTGIIKIGDRVLVPFGRKKELEEGYVIGFKEKTDFEVKDIASIENEEGLSKESIELAKLMSRRYFCNIADCIKLMLQPGTSTKNFSNRMKEKNLVFVKLRKQIDEIEFDIEIKKLKSEKQIKALRFLYDNNEILKTDLENLTETSSAILKTLEKNGYIEFYEKQVNRNPFIYKNIEKSLDLKLTEEQQNALDKVVESINEKKFKEFLLYGVTGSGKTEVYLQIIKEVLKKEKSVIVLVPEISLTPQMIDRFIARFGKDEIAVLHSKLSIGERYDEWQRIKNNEAKIVIGARSAIFAPVKDIGAIIIDEEHDQSYKSETSPRYHAKEIARYIAKTYNIPLVLGSATPDITTYYNAQNGNIDLLKLSKRANKSELPKVEIVDLRYELAIGNKSMLSTSLYDKIEKNLANKKQTILFLNRRGFSTFVMCRDCGYTVKCKHCNITLTYHLKENRLKCHYCGYEQNSVTICPECNSKNIRYFGTGTQKLEQEILKQFPEAKTIRMDIDTVTKKNSHEEILNKFKNDNIDILIGTQMVVKGHHFPNVTLVGVIAADSSLYIEDYRANERTFQILTQVAGRAGREKNKGEVVVQTYNPQNFSIECAQKQDYDMFYDTEIELRRQLKYPPFCDIIMIVISGTDEKHVSNISNKIYKSLKQYDNIINPFKPMPAPIDKIKNKYRWRIIIKGKINGKTLDIIKQATDVKIGNKDTRIIVDTNPSNMM